MAKIIKLSSYKTLIKNPKLSELYDKYDDITESQCYSLIITLYDNDKIFWINPLDWNFIHKASDISISFLSKCYYVWGDNIVMAGPDKGPLKLSYKEHIKKFIDKEYLFDVRKLGKSPQKVSSNSPPGAATNKPKVLQRFPVILHQGLLVINPKVLKRFLIILQQVLLLLLKNTLNLNQLA